MAGDAQRRGAERRRYQRADVNVPFEYQFHYTTPGGPVSGSGSATTENLSCGGLMFCADRFIPVPVFLDMRIRLDEAGTAAQAFARVAWCCEDPDGGYKVGVRFTGINPELRNAINSRVLRELHRSICEAGA